MLRKIATVITSTVIATAGMSVALAPQADAGTKAQWTRAHFDDCRTVNSRNCVWDRGGRSFVDVNGANKYLDTKRTHRFLSTRLASCNGAGYFLSACSYGTRHTVVTTRNEVAEGFVTPTSVKVVVTSYE